MKCPVCNVYDVDPDSKENWCTKCTGVLAHRTITPTPPHLLGLIKHGTAYLLDCDQAVLFAQQQADETEGTAEHRVASMLLTMAMANRDRAARDLAQLRGEV